VNSPLLIMLDFQTILPYLKVDDDGIPVDPKLKHAGYDKSVAIARDIKDVFKEDFPEYLKVKRPKEKPVHLKYRETIYLNKVMKFRTKAMSLITTIAQNDDFNVTFKDDNIFKAYTEHEMFENQTLPEWFFSEWARFSIDDPNAVIAPVFKVFANSDQEFNQPTLKIFSSVGVIQLNSDICVLRGDERTWIDVNGKQEKIGRNLYFYDKDSFVICKQVGKKFDGRTETNYNWQIIGQNVQMLDGEVLSFQPFRTNTTKIQAQRIGRILGEKVDGEVQLYRSEISDALPYLKTIGLRISDTEIEYLQHIHTVEWFVTSRHECKAPGCENGYVKNPNWVPGSDMPPKYKCSKCDDKGFPNNGLETIIHVVSDDGGIDQNRTSTIPNPPGGFIPRNIDTVRELRTEIANNEAAAYGTMDMLYMFETALNTSGKSKSYDRQDNYIRRADISVHTKKQIDFGYRSTASFMLGIVGNIERYLPTVNVPTDSFDLSTQEEVLAELQTAKGVVDGNVKNALEIVFAQKRFGKDTQLTKLLKLKNRIDPYVSITGPQKFEILDLRLFNDIKIFGLNSEKLKNIIRKNYLSKHIDSIIRDLTLMNPDFLDLDFDLQADQIEKQLELYLPDKISEDVYKPIKQEPMVDVVKEN
jgi:hypothetical protein